MKGAEAGTLGIGEHHPAADSAMAYLRSLSAETLLLYQQTFASLSLSGNRLAELCGETLRRVMAGEPVSDRYLLGLAWTIREMSAR
ncbi:hypothetical protein [Roseicella sp. DB1501]|uniref:hypothetical protein n=1 Tax=Roseicella sp. DB1501 TaxID=2730925 RepID=UPI00149228C3|nr:hypothetical protein [Roseicella sp. DB1501]NOG70468.1 hypothetical protein [Roseicella sp. DB1501]